LKLSFLREETTVVNMNAKIRFVRVFFSLLITIASVQVSPVLAATIAIDTGHSATEPGATSASGLPEYQFNKRITRHILNALTQAGHRVIDVDALGANLSLLERANASKGADLLVSVHHDSIQETFIRAGRAKEFSGFSVFISNLNPHPKRSLHCAETIGTALRLRGARPSLYHAENILGENRPLLNAHLGIHKYDGLAVLRLASTSAVLIEAGVIVNPLEERILLQPSVQFAVASAIAIGISACVPKP
jgi:N-acetylmuramoyl-L-alanine amidase